MRAEQNVLRGLSLHLVGQSDGILELKVLEQRLSELRERVGVSFLFAENHWQSDRLECIVLEKR